MQERPPNGVKAFLGERIKGSPPAIQNFSRGVTQMKITPTTQHGIVGSYNSEHPQNITP